VCEWSEIDALRRQLADRIRLGLNCAAPFEVLGCIDSAELHRKVAEIYTEAEHPAVSESIPGNVSFNGRLTIGYFSADFHGHATGYLIAELLELHDRSRFRVVGFSFGPDSRDPMRRRLASACDEFVDVRDRSDEEIVALARQMRIDIAVDLKGYTTDGRPGVFARRAGPIQVSYLGYPGTSGATYIDYLVADCVVVPVEDFGDYSEKVCQLPGCYQPNDRQRMISTRQYSRSELGLPKEGFVYCCFNNSWKISPEVFECWMTILKLVPCSVLWLLEFNECEKGNLQAEAGRRGVDSSRLIFGGRLPLDEHLARHRCADLFLDTWPYCAHTTASDALWAGLPILACRGNSFAARVSASLLRSVGLSSLVASGPADYIEQAVSLANDPESLAGLRCHLQSTRLECELFDTERYARHLEAGYVMMAERARAGLSPDHLIVQPLGA
jgi:predicted O-linked N-acetylglucosamine transferase (SPINDLY family)